MLNKKKGAEAPFTNKIGFMHLVMQRQHLGFEKPKEYLSLALNLTLPVSKSPSIEVERGDLSKCLKPSGQSVFKIPCIVVC